MKLNFFARKSAPPKPKPGMQLERWALADKIKSGEEKLIFGYSQSSVARLETVEAQTKGSPCPLGWIWYRHECGNVLCIAECFVPAHLRRAGIMTAMFEKLLEWYPETRQVVTGRVTEFSLPWAQKMGFVFNEDFDRWELSVTPKKKSK